MKKLLLLIFLGTLSACNTLSKRDPERAALHLKIGSGFLMQGLYPQAMSELTKAEQLDDRNPVIQNNLGLAYYVRNKLPTAETKFRAAIRLDPRYSDAKNNLARTLLDQDKVNEAMRLLLEAEGDLTYGFPEKTYANLGMAYFKQGRFQKAEEYLARSLEIRRQNCITANYYGRTLFELKKVEQSAQMLDQAIEYCRTARYEDPIFFSAMSYFTLGEKEKTRARIEELLKDYPKSKYVAKAKGMLELLGQ